MMQVDMYNTKEFCNFVQTAMLDDLQQIADKRNVPGPLIDNHNNQTDIKPIDGICFCKTCLLIPMYVKRSDVSIFLDYAEKAKIVD
jgi:hypothetical protein